MYAFFKSSKRNEKTLKNNLIFEKLSLKTKYYLGRQINLYPNIQAIQERPLYLNLDLRGGRDELLLVT